MEKMEPTAQSTSRLEEPSMGSTSTTYFPEVLSGLDDQRLGHLLGDYGADDIDVFECLDEDRVARLIELLHLFTLDVHSAGKAGHRSQGCTPHVAGDDLPPRYRPGP